MYTGHLYAGILQFTAISFFIFGYFFWGERFVKILLDLEGVGLLPSSSLPPILVVSVRTPKRNGVSPSPELLLLFQKFLDVDHVPSPVVPEKAARGDPISFTQLPLSQESNSLTWESVITRPQREITPIGLGALSPKIPYKTSTKAGAIASIFALDSSLLCSASPMT